MRRFVVLGLLGLTPLFAQHGKLDDAAKSKRPEISDLAAVEAGRKQFANACAACHGAEGQGGRGPNLRARLGSDELKDDALFMVIQKGVPGGGMPGADLPEPQAWQLITFLRALTAPAAESHTPGDVAAGQQIFWGEAGCGGCHSVRGKGGALGPDLTNAGGTHSLPELREAILNPSDNPVAGYLNAVVQLKDGRTLKGVARNRTNYSLQLQDGQGKLHLLSMERVREVTILKQSLMPGDYGKRLTPEQLTNVLAYLSRQTIRPVEAAK